MTDYERGLRDGRAENTERVLKQVDKIAKCIYWLQTEDRKGKQSDIVADMWMLCGVLQADLRQVIKASKANPRPPRQGGDGGGEGS